MFIGMWLSLVERLVWDQDAAGSNPVIPTIIDTYSNSSFRRCGFESHVAYIMLLAELVYALILKINFFLIMCLVLYWGVAKR